MTSGRGEDRSFRRRLYESSRFAGLAVRLAWRASPVLLLAILLLLGLQALLSPLQLALSRAIIDRAALDLGLLSEAQGLVARWPLAAWIVLAAVAVVVSRLIQPFAVTFEALVGDRLTGYVTAQLIAAANRWQGLARFEDPAFADDLERARTQAATCGSDLILYGTRAALALFTAMGLSLVLASVHLLAPLLLIGATLPRTMRQFEYANRVWDRLYRQTPDARRLEYSREVLLMPDPAKDIRLYGLGSFFRARYAAIFERTIVVVDRLRRQLLRRVLPATAVAPLAAGAIYVYVVWLIIQGERTVGDLALYGGAATMLQAQLLSLGIEIGFLPRVFHYLPSLFRILEAPPDLPLPAHPRPAPRAFREGIVFERVAFSYPGNPTPVLHDVSFHVAPEESVALVGRNGAGKTTVVKLLLRLYDPTKGRILLDGVDLRDYDLEGLRRQMGVIFQDFVRYELTAGENIGLGQVEALSDSDRLHAAAARAGADTLLGQLPQGLDTQLGREFGGRELSGGEWQKLALARAFVRDCQLLVLDEPTAALDVQTEYEVYQHFHELTRGRMTVLISHRFSTVRMANRILYLADGRIQEAGTHADLLAHDGEYARLYRLQASQYVGGESVPTETGR